MRSWHVFGEILWLLWWQLHSVKQQKQKSDIQEAAKGNKTYPTNESMKKTCMSAVLTDKAKTFWKKPHVAIMIYNGEASYNGILNQSSNIEMVQFTPT